MLHWGRCDVSRNMGRCTWVSSNGDLTINSPLLTTYPPISITILLHMCFFPSQWWMMMIPKDIHIVSASNQQGVCVRRRKCFINTDVRRVECWWACAGVIQIIIYYMCVARIKNLASQRWCRVRLRLPRKWKACVRDVYTHTLEGIPEGLTLPAIPVQFWWLVTLA